MFGNEPSVTMDVSKNEHYVCSIQFGKQKKQLLSPAAREASSPNDSIITEALLHMTSQEGHKEDLIVGDDHEVVGDNGLVIRKNEDMDRVIRELTQAVIKSTRRSVVVKAMGGGGGKINNATFTRRSRLRNSLRRLKALGSNHGSSAMKELWERSGMKTNGRKLVLEAPIEEVEKADGLETSHRRRRRKRGSKLPTKRFPSVSTGSSGSIGSLSSSNSSVCFDPLSACHTVRLH